MPKYFQLILDGKKRFELRLADFECNLGDILLLEEWNPETKEYTGRKIEKEIDYISKTKDFGFCSKEDVDKFGFQILQLK